MLLLEHFNVLLPIFKLLGLATYSVTTKTSKLKHFTDCIPIILSMVLGLCLAIYLIFFPNFKSYSPIYTIINFASLISFLLVIATANCQCFFYRSIYENIFYRSIQIENRCRDILLAKFPMKMAFYYRLKVLLIFSLFFVSQGLLFAEVLIISGANKLKSFFLTASLRSIYPIAILHVVLYGDLIAMFIKEINVQIRHSPKCFSASSRIQFLKNVKLLHMDVFQLAVQINTFFGWNLLILIINGFIYIIKQLYWIFLAMELKWHKLALIGELLSH